MTRVLLKLPDGSLPKLERVAESIRTAIRSKQLNPSDKIPSTRSLAHDFAMHRHTVMQALDNLVHEGWLVVEPRRGYRVADKPPDDYFPNKEMKTLASKTSLLLADLQERPDYGADLDSADPKVIWNFRSGRSDLRLLPTDEIKTCLSEGLRRKKQIILDYGHAAGHPDFVEELTNYLRLVRSIAGRDIIITNGCQEALYIAVKLLVRSGTHVGLEAWTYPSVLSLMRGAGATIHAVQLDREGMIPEALEEACRRHPIRLIFLTPSHQFPTTSTMSAQRRQAIYAICSQNRIAIIEDDFDHEYHYASAPPAPLATIDGDGLVIYTSSLSKVMFPAARVGFLALPRGLKGAFLRSKEEISIQCGLWLQDALARWMRSGDAVAHLNRTRRIYASRLQALLKHLEDIRDVGLDWVVPEGGMALWLKTPWSTRDLASVAEQQGILIHSEQSTRVDGLDGCHLRIGFAKYNEGEMQTGLKALLDLANRFGRRLG